jgi:hypothetical protein
MHARTRLLNQIFGTQWKIKKELMTLEKQITATDACMHLLVGSNV